MSKQICQNAEICSPVGRANGCSTVDAALGGHFASARTDALYTRVPIVRLCAIVTATEIRNLYARFQRLDRDQSGSLSAEELMAIPEFAMNPLANRLLPFFLSFESSTPADPAGLAMTRELTFPGFIRLLSSFHPLASRREKLECIPPLPLLALLSR